MGAQIIEFAEGMKVGRGYNRLTHESFGSPAVVGAVSAIPEAGGQQVSIDCITVQDVETLHKSLGVSVEAEGSYMGAEASAKVQYVNQCDFSRYSTYVMVRVSVRNAFESIDSPEFSPEATELLVNNNNERFRERFGDSYISGLRKGGEYFAIYQLTGSDESEKESLAVDVHAAFNGLVGSAELNTSITTATSSSKSHLEVRVHVFRQGSIGTADLKVEDIMATARQFPIAVSGVQAFPYAVQLQDYAGLKSPNDTFNYYDIANQQAVLEDLARRRFELLALRDDLRYILKNSGDFVNADGTAVDRAALSASFDEIVAQINTMQTQGAACSRDATKCTFTPYDASRIALPKLAEAPKDDLATKGGALAAQDPLATAMRAAQSAAGQRGFDLGMAAAEGNTLPGPGKQRLHDSLPLGEQGGFEQAVEFSLTRNKNADTVTRGRTVIGKDPGAGAARAALPEGLAWLGFDIATGIFGTEALGALGNTLKGPGSGAIREALGPVAKGGFDAAVAYWKPGGSF